jgi:hypothetical protein
LKELKKKHDEVSKRVDDHVETSKALENTITDAGRE